ncbi:MAG TPA: antibiotic biosynthesis monooxygenase [Thermoanaerobaculia bacterium]|jgi:heme-degrading monooxygenase HmoA|nr:antibiotic biosynthesis monooxygenase [Thermoanaerobaculia bacterium]
MSAKSPKPSPSGPPGEGGGPLIVRLWHGRTRPEDADTYHQMLREEILPGIHRIAGYRGCYLLWRAAGDEVEFVTLTLWESLHAVRRFAGDDYERAVIHPAAEALLTRRDERSTHYEAEWSP